MMVGRAVWRARVALLVAALAVAAAVAQPQQAHEQQAWGRALRQDGVVTQADAAVAQAPSPADGEHGGGWGMNGW